MPSSPTSSSYHHCNGGLIYQFLQRKLVGSILFVSLLFLLPSTTTVVNATTILCNTPEDCIFPQTQSCPDFIASNTFYGTCCSLSDDPALGNCVVTISNGHCIWENQHNPGIQYLSEFNQPCPQSDYDPFVTQPPANPPPDDPTTDPPVDVPATPPAPPTATTTPLPTPPPPPPPPTALPTTQQPSISPMEVTNPTIQPTMFPTRTSILTETCGSTTTTTEVDDGDGEICEMLLKQSCPEFISQNNFVGTCCSLEHIAETGQCIVRISNGHCFWEPKNGSCDPLSGANCGELGGIFYKSLSTQSCPPSGFDVFATPTAIGKKEEKTRILTIIWVSILLVVVFVRILLCFAKCYADKKNMEDEELDDEYQDNGSHDVYSSKSKSSSATTSLASNTPPRIKRQSIDDDDNIDPENGSNNIGIQNIELVDQNQQHVLNQHKAYFEEVLAGFEDDVIGRRCLETQSQEGGADGVSAATAAIGKEIT